MFIKRCQGIFLIDCTILMLVSLVSVWVVWGELGYILKLQEFSYADTEQLLYLSVITNELIDDRSEIIIGSSSLSTAFEDVTYLLQLKNNNLYLYKNGSGTQILMRGIKEITFYKENGLIRCSVMEQNKEYMEWGIIIGEK